jgi:uridine kinase
MFEELIKQINHQLATSPLVVVGISGFAGSGKTTLAKKLAEHYEIDDGQVIHLDNLFMSLPRGTGLFDDYNWEVLNQIIKDSKAGKDLDYQGTGADGNSYPFRHQKKLPKVLIVEGIRLYRPELMEHFNLSVWVNCPADLALRRAKARDIKQGHDEEYMKRWDTEWGPLNQQYFDEYHPEKLATFLYEEFGE